MTQDRAALTKKLRVHFGFRRFREGQAEAVHSALSGRDTIVVMPTGSGKSLCYQLPALELEGMTLVVSPLIALMKDQADALARRGISAVAYNSSLSASKRRRAEQAITSGTIEFLFTTPERLADPAFRDLVKQRPIDLFVVDEAHCISHWGHDFRPEYLNLGVALNDLGRPPVLALTATATDDVVADIRRLLTVPDAELVHTGYDRPNIFLEAIRVEDEVDRHATLLRLLREDLGCGIVYAATVKAVEELTASLNSQGIQVGAYHGRLGAKKRSLAQDRFMAGAVPIMVATNAFGLGIDKPDIRFILHAQIPGSLESYYQEFGRAGRDGLPARASLLYHPDDSKLQRFFQSGGFPDTGDLVNVHHALKRLVATPPTRAELNAICPVPRSRTQVVLSLFRSRGIITDTTDRRIELREPDLELDDCERIARYYRNRGEEARIKQEQMVEYVEGRHCRWTYLLDYFHTEERIDNSRCGHCDRCLVIDDVPTVERVA